MMSNTLADKLQDLITAKQDMKDALTEKGFPPTGGLVTYADAIDFLVNGLRDVEVIYIPNGISILIQSSYYTPDGGTMKHTLPKIIAFDITDCENFNLSTTSDISTTIYNLTADNRKIKLVVFK